MKAEDPPAAGSCFHCGQPLPDDPPQAVIEGAPRAFCCRGCAAAAEWIRSAGLDDYYRLRGYDDRGLPKVETLSRLGLAQ